jgi:hypothetical protein
MHRPVLNVSDTHRAARVRMSHPIRPLRELYGAGGTTHAALYAPDPVLSGCVRAYLSRTITDTAQLTPDERCNRFPPTPTCVVVWVLRGHDSRVPESGSASSARGDRLPVVFSGPHTRASSSRNPGPVHFFTMLMYPDAAQALTGLAIGPHVDRYSRFADLFDPDWRRMAREVIDAEDDRARVRSIEAFLRPRWAAVQARRHGEHGASCGGLATAVDPARIEQWVGAVLAQAPKGDGKVGERQVARRIRASTGQSSRQLRGLARMESALIGANLGDGARRVHWSDLAVESGFSDQAHLCREFRRHIGMRPGDLGRGLTHESAWVLRIWG